MACVALVVPATTYRATDFLQAAERLGSEVVVASDQRQALASVMGDRALRLDLRRPAEAAQRLAAHARKVGVDAIVGVDDRGVEIAALASVELGLAHSPPEAVAATRDKARARDLLAAAGVRQPAWRTAATPEDARAAAESLGSPGSAVVVKPVSLSASRGVIRADDPAEAEAAAARALTILEAAREPGHLLVERFVAGPEVAVEGLVRGGRLQVLAVFDKPDPLDGPYFEESLYVTPSRLPAAVQADIAEAARAAVDALGLTEGPVHAEFRVPEGQVWVLELAARTIGGLCGRALRFGLGMTLEEVVLRHALGMPLHALAREGAAAGVLMLPIERAGVLTAVDGLEEARAVPGIEGVEITIPPGDAVRPLPESDRYLGFAFASGADPEEVEAALRHAQALLDVRIEPAAADPCAPTGPPSAADPRAASDPPATVGRGCASD